MKELRKGERFEGKNGLGLIRKEGRKERKTEGRQEYGEQCGWGNIEGE